MPPFRPLKRKKLIRYLKQLGFDGPYSGKRHQFMVRGDTLINHSQPPSRRYWQKSLGRNTSSSGYQ